MDQSITLNIVLVALTFIHVLQSHFYVNEDQL
jgi:hypothetical protein